MTNTSGDDVRARYVESEISLIEILNAILRHWRTVVVLPLLFASAFGVKALMQQRVFFATASFVPQAGESRTLGGAAVLAQQFGISLGGDRSGQSPQFYEDLLRTRTILRRAVESEYQLPSAGGSRQPGTLIDYWKISEQDVPGMPTWRRAADRLRSAISTNVRRETGVIELTVTTADANVAEQIASRLLRLLDDYHLEVRQARAREEGRFVSSRLEDVRRDVGLYERAVERFLRQNRDFRNSPELTFEHDRLQRLVLVQHEVYATLLTAQEQAQMDGMRDTPILQIIDAPGGSTQAASRKVALRAVIGFMLGLILAIASALLREAARNGRQGRDPKYREFENLVRGVLSDLKAPKRWVAR